MIFKYFDRKDAMMKKIICILLAAVALLLAVSCKKDDTEIPKETEPKEVTEAPKEPVIPEGYMVFDNTKISFAYPKEWTMKVNKVVDDGKTGNNVTVASEPYTDIYLDMDVKTFNSTIEYALEMSGMMVSAPSIEQVKNDIGIKMTKISYKVGYNGVPMIQTMFIVAVGDENYIVTVTEVKSDAELVQNVFNTLNIVKK